MTNTCTHTGADGSLVKLSQSGPGDGVRSGGDQEGKERKQNLSQGLACWVRGRPDTVEHARRISLTPTEGGLQGESPYSCLLLQCPNMAHVCCCCSAAKLCSTLQPHGLQHTRPPCPSLSPRVCSTHVHI